MRNRKLTCPECGKPFSFHFMKNRFSSKTKCPSCQEQLYIENKMFPYVLIAIVIFLFSDTIFAFAEQMKMSSFITNILAFVSLLIICILLIIVFRTLLGDSFLYSVRSHREFKDDKERIEKMKKQVKRKQEKK